MINTLKLVRENKNTFSNADFKHFEIWAQENINKNLEGLYGRDELEEQEWLETLHSLTRFMIYGMNEPERQNEMLEKIRSRLERWLNDQTLGPEKKAQLILEDIFWWRLWNHSEVLKKMRGDPQFAEVKKQAIALLHPECNELWIAYNTFTDAVFGSPMENAERKKILFNNHHQITIDGTEAFRREIQKGLTIIEKYTPKFAKKISIDEIVEFNQITDHYAYMDSTNGYIGTTARATHDYSNLLEQYEMNPSRHTNILPLIRNYSAEQMQKVWPYWIATFIAHEDQHFQDKDTVFSNDKNEDATLREKSAFNAELNFFSELLSNIPKDTSLSEKDKHLIEVFAVALQEDVKAQPGTHWDFDKDGQLTWHDAHICTDRVR